MNPPHNHRRGGLGRGLDSLLPPTPGEREVHGATKEASLSSSSEPLRDVDITLVIPSPHQPRKDFSEKELQELAQSIRQDGVIQPIIVTQQGSMYHVIAGERRLKAAQIAGLTQVPVVVREVAEEDKFRLALIENIQRSDLNMLEEAEAYREIIEKFSLNRDECAEMVGKDRSTIANALRLLELPEEIKDDVRGRLLSGGHARALLSLPTKSERVDAARMVKEKGLSVRATEQLCRQLKKQPQKRGYKSKTSPKENHPDLEYWAEQLRKVFSTRVQMQGNTDQGKIEIHYFSGEELERILALMMSPMG